MGGKTAMQAYTDFFIKTYFELAFLEPAKVTVVL
jgi:hypothetical protein